jgi:hypothetical protein
MALTGIQQETRQVRKSLVRGDREAAGEQRPTTAEVTAEVRRSDRELPVQVTDDEEE